MDTARGIDFERLRRLNNPSYVRTRLAITYVLIFALFASVGAFANSFFADILPDELKEKMLWSFLPPPAETPKMRFIYEIINNSVDIFKISFIILLSGFTYIAAFINRISAALAGLVYGLNLAVGIDAILSGERFGVEAAGFPLVSLYVLRLLLLVAVVILAGAVSEQYSYVWQRFRNIYVLISSLQFWKYVVFILVLFGYVILNEMLFRLIIKIFV